LLKLFENIAEVLHIKNILSVFLVCIMTLYLFVTEMAVSHLIKVMTVYNLNFLKLEILTASIGSRNCTLSCQISLESVKPLPDYHNISSFKTPYLDLLGAYLDHTEEY